MIRIALLIALMFATGIARSECENPSLVVDTDAAGVKYRDCWQVEYVVEEAFPAEGLIQRLTGELTRQGWRELDFDPINPTDSDAAVHAWDSHRASDKDTTRVDQWLGWFIRDDQSRVQVTLRTFGRGLDDFTSRPIFTTITFVTPEQWETRPK